MTVTHFETRLEVVRADLQEQACRRLFYSPSEFETAVAERLRQEDFGGVEVRYQPGSQVFPDVRINGFGVEAKFKRSGEWKEVANSVFEGSRDLNIEYIFVMFANMTGEPEVRLRRYEDAIVHVRTSHVPRFVISLDNDSTSRLVDNEQGIPISYVQFRALSNADKMQHLRAYARRKHPGASLWWLPTDEPEQQTSDAAILRFTGLDKATKRQLAAEALVLVPRCLMSGLGGNNRAKTDAYSQVGIYWIRAHGVYSGNIRDSISAGSMIDDHGYATRLENLLATLAPDIRSALGSLSDEILSEYWGNHPEKGDRLQTWLATADREAGATKPSAVFSRVASDSQR